MDLTSIWNSAIQSVISKQAEEGKKTVILLFKTQVTLDIKDSHINFLCSSVYIYKTFNSYALEFHEEVCRLIGRSDMSLSVSIVSPNKLDISADEQQSSNLHLSKTLQSQQQPPSLLSGGSSAVLHQELGKQKQTTLFSNHGYYNMYGANNAMYISDSMGLSINTNAEVGSYANYIKPHTKSVSTDITQSEKELRKPERVVGPLDDKFPINPNKTFENYIMDPDNVMLYTQASKVASEPGSQAVNPLFVYGSSGLGKTHILLAIANRIKETKPNIKVLYVRAEEFLRHYIESLQKGPYDVSFHGLYKSYDVFIVDDVQEFASKEKTRDIFFDIIADFTDKEGRQLVLASDVSPQNLKNFSSRLKTRFGSGVCIEVEQPSSNTRKAIVESKCKEMCIYLPEHVQTFIAENIKSNVRDIEGAIKTLNIHLEAKKELSDEEVSRILSDQIGISNKALTMEDVINCVSEKFDVSVDDMKSSKKTRQVSQARSVAMTLIRDLIPNSSYTTIGQKFCKDHSSVCDAIKRTKANISKDPSYAVKYHDIELSLRKD